MDTLRVALILVGAVVVGGVYLWSRRSRDGESSPANDGAADDVLPEVEELSGMRANDGGKDGESSRDGGRRPPELLITLYVKAPRGRAFTGPALEVALANAGLSWGDMRIYHALSDDGRAVFSVANALEPGTFDPERMVGFSTPGVVLFMRLPGPLSGREAFARMLRAGRDMVEELGGRLQDEAHAVMTGQSARDMQDRITAFELEYRAFKENTE